MNRERKFRGIKKSNGKYIIGDLNKIDDKYYIINRDPDGDNMNSPDDYEVKPESVSDFTGFQDCNLKDIYEGDDLCDWTEVDGCQMQSRQRVFWNQPTGSWHLDQSFEQDQSFSTELWLELQDFKHEVLKHKP